MGRKKSSDRATPHSKKKSAARDRAAMSLDELWAADIEQRLLADCHPFQLDAALDPHRRVSFLVGRGGGKTTVLRVRALIKLTTIPNARLIYAATSGPEAERLNWEPLKKVIDELGLRDEFSFHETDRVCTCKRTGGTYQMIGLDNKKEVNKWRGQPFNEVQIDETASHDPVLLENFLDRAVGPRLGERHGCIVLSGTPGHVLRGRFYDATRKGSERHRPYRLRDDADFADWTGWSSHAWSMLDVLALPDADRYAALRLNWEEALIEKKDQQWSDQNPIWLREYLGLWASDHTTAMYAYQAYNDDGTPLNQWLPFGDVKLEGLPMLKAAIAALPEGFDDWQFGYGADLGSRDPFALTILAFAPSDPWRRFFHVFSFERRRMYPRTIAELLIGKEAADKAVRSEVYTEVGGLFGLTGWPVAAVADLAGLGDMVLDELAKTYGITFKAAEKKNKPGAIEVFNGDLVDGRMFVIAKSPLEEQVSTLQWKPDEYDNPKEDKAVANHSADSATYIRTELGAMFSGASAAPSKEREAAERAIAQGDRPPAPKSQVKPIKRPAPSKKHDPWGDAPLGQKAKGEFNALLRGGDFKHI
jgi:hypothetical protein